MRSAPGEDVRARTCPGSVLIAFSLLRGPPARYCNGPRLLVRQGCLGRVLPCEGILRGILVDRDQEGMGIASKGIGDHLSDHGDRLGGGFLARDLALVAAALLASARLLLSRGHLSRTLYLSIFVYFRSVHDKLGAGPG